MQSLLSLMFCCALLARVFLAAMILILLCMKSWWLYCSALYAWETFQMTNCQFFALLTAHLHIFLSLDTKLAAKPAYLWPFCNIRDTAVYTIFYLNGLILLIIEFLSMTWTGGATRSKKRPISSSRHTAKLQRSCSAEWRPGENILPRDP